jgi:hypothetical protein
MNMRTRALYNEMLGKGAYMQELLLMRDLAEGFFEGDAVRPFGGAVAKALATGKLDGVALENLAAAVGIAYRRYFEIKEAAAQVAKAEDAAAREQNRQDTAREVLLDGQPHDSDYPKDI